MNLSDISPNVYPINLLSECSTGLCLFGAGFYGANDAIHMYNAGVRAVQVVDTDGEKLSVMEGIYPPTWVFDTNDVTVWVPKIANAKVITWDIVSVDAPTSMFPWVLSNFDEIATLANKYLVVTMAVELAEAVAYFCDNLDWELIDRMNRSQSGLIELLIFKRVGLSKTTTGGNK